jgi:AcrR family transcriptional regulator
MGASTGAAISVSFVAGMICHFKLLVLNMRNTHFLKVINPHILRVKALPSKKLKKPNSGNEQTDATSAASLPRRKPAQQRSRERMDRILLVAAGLIESGGSDQLRMSDVAEGAEISIGSLYQYFPDKSAVIRSLAERYNAQSRKCIEEAFENVASRGELETAFGGLIDLYYSIFLAEPVMRDIWSGMQADKTLMELELAENRMCAELLASAMRRAHKKADPKKFAVTALVVWQLGEAATRLAITVGRREGDAIIAGYKRMALREILSPD